MEVLDGRRKGWILFRTAAERKKAEPNKKPLTKKCNFISAVIV
jgi:hypothetical protein